LHGARDPIYDLETAEVIDVLERGQHPLLIMEMIRARPALVEPIRDPPGRVPSHRVPGRLHPERTPITGSS